MKAHLHVSVLFAISLLSNLIVLAGEGRVKFVENKGQVSDQFHQPRTDIKYVVGGEKFTCHLKSDGFSYQLFQETGRPENPVRPIDRWKHKNDAPVITDFYRLDMNWINSNPNVQVLSGDQLPGYDNFYLAVCPKGVTNVRSYSSVTYNNLYSGIDMKWYELNGQLKYDYYVKAGADYKQIQWEIKGAENMQLTAAGELIIETPLGKLIEEAPSVFQNGRRLTANWKIEGTVLSFDIKGVDLSQDLIIDPLVRAWGSYYGGSGYEELSWSHADVFNNFFFTGGTSTATSLNIATVGSHQSTYGGGSSGAFGGDAMLVKMNANGVRQWSTYYGGSGTEGAGGCSSDSQGNIYMVGITSSTNTGVIATSGSYQTTLTASPHSTITSDVFLVKFDPLGVRLWGTYYGDSLYDWANGVAVDKFDNVFISGGTEYVDANSSPFATSGCHQPQHNGGSMDAFLGKFTSSGTRLWGTYFGGEGFDNSYYCAADTLGNVYITGNTTSTIALSIASAGAHQTLYQGGISDGFLAKFSSTGARLWSTYYGDHTEEYGINCEVDHLNQVVLFGTTDSFLGTNFGTPGTAQPAYGGGNSEGFVAKFTAAGVRRWGTYYGGTGYEELGVGCVSKSGSIFMCGRTSIGSGTAIATCGTYQDVHGGSNDCFIAQLDTLGRRQWGTFFGGTGDEPTWSCLAIDGNDNLYLAGMAKATTASSIMTTGGGHQTIYGGGSYDLFLERFNPCVINPPAKTTGTSSCIGQVAVFQATHSCISKWYSDPSLKNLLYTGPSYSLSILTPDTSFYYADESCGFNTGAKINVHAGITPTVSIVPSSTTICSGETVTLTPSGAATYSWTGIIDPGVLELKPKSNTTYTLAGFSAEGCKSTSTTMVVVDPCAGLADKNNLPLFRFFPNPTSGKAQLEVEENSSFTLYGLRGEIVWESQTLEKSNQLDFSELPAGVYFGEVNNATATQRFKIVVAR